jgi:hypothetical protein
MMKMKTTKPKPGAAAKRMGKTGWTRQRIFVASALNSVEARISRGNTGNVGVMLSIPVPFESVCGHFSPATARRIAKALLAAAGGTP